MMSFHVKGQTERAGLSADMDAFEHALNAGKERCSLDVGVMVSRVNRSIKDTWLDDWRIRFSFKPTDDEMLDMSLRVRAFVRVAVMPELKRLWDKGYSIRVMDNQAPPGTNLRFITPETGEAIVRKVALWCISMPEEPRTWRRTVEIDVREEQHESE